MKVVKYKEGRPNIEDSPIVIDYIHVHSTAMPPIEEDREREKQYWKDLSAHLKDSTRIYREEH